ASIALPPALHLLCQGLPVTLVRLADPDQGHRGLAPRKDILIVELGIGTPIVSTLFPLITLLAHSAASPIRTPSSRSRPQLRGARRLQLSALVGTEPEAPPPALLHEPGTLSHTSPGRSQA